MLSIVFSKDRPLQLDATLRSFVLHCQDFTAVSVKVIVKASTPECAQAYTVLASDFIRHPNITFIAETDFREQVLHLIVQARHLLWLVDDNIFVRDFKLQACSQLLDQHPDAVGFSLRLGYNTEYCYPLERTQKLPCFIPVGAGIFKFNWTSAEFDFGYPLEVSSSLYRCAELQPLLASLSFFNPNSLEEQLSRQAHSFRESHPYLLCPERSYTFCNPINKVQTTCATNRAGEKCGIPAVDLLDAYLAGKRLDVSRYAGFIPNACHQEVQMYFLPEAVAEPLISVIIPCYNQAEFLPDAVASIVGQTFKDWECIIVNDGSTDETSRVAHQLMDTYPDKNIRLIEKENGGLSDARNVGIKAAYGKWILPLDSDDIFAPTFMGKAVSAIEQDDTINLVFTNMQEFGVKTGSWIPDNYSAQLIREQNTFIYASLYKKVLWENVGGYYPGIPWGAEDWNFWISCSKVRLKPYRIPEKLFYYRTHGGTSMYDRMMLHWNEVRAFIRTLHEDIYPASQLLLDHEIISSCTEETVTYIESKIFPKHGDLAHLHLWRGLYLIGRGDVKAAIDCFEYASRNLLESWQPIYCLTQIQLKSRLRDEYVSSCNKLQSVNPELLTMLPADVKTPKNIKSNIRFWKELHNLPLCTDPNQTDSSQIMPSGLSFPTEQDSATCTSATGESCRKILIACDYFWPSIGGTELFVEKIASLLINDMYQVDVATSWMENRTETTHNRINIYQYRCGGNLNEGGPSGEIEEYRNLISSGNYDTVIVLGHPDLWIGLGIVNLPTPRPRIIFIPSINAENILNWSNSSLFRQAAEILASADSLITVTESGYDKKFIEAVGLPHVFIPHAVEQNASSKSFRSAYKIPDDRHLLVMVANFWTVKNHLALLQILANSPGDWCLLLIGYPISSQMQYFSQVKQLAARDQRISIVEGLPPDKAASAIRDADILLIPSKGESAGPLVLLQAMSFGTPWIATPECNAVNDEAGGVVAPLANFPFVIDRMLSSPEINRKLGLLGQEHWRSSFTWERVWPAFKNVIENKRTTINLSMPQTIRDKNNSIVKELLSPQGQVTRQDHFPNPIKTLPTVSVIIPTYNRSSILGDFLNALEAQTYPHDRFEVIICDDGSKDGTASIIQSFRSTFQLLYIHQQNSGPASARNRALEKATGTIVLIMNDDAIADRNLLYSHVKVHARMNGKKAAVLGSFSFADNCLTTPLMHFLQNSDILFQYARMTPGEFYEFGYFWTCNISIERKAFVEAGLFDEDFKEPAGEDTEIGYRLAQKGYSILYDPSCCAIHKHTIDFNSFCRRQVSVGRNSILVALKHPEIAKRVTGLDNIEHAEQYLLRWYHENVNTACQAMSYINRINMAPGLETAQIVAGANDISAHVRLINQFWLYQGFLDGISKHLFHKHLPNNRLRITFITPGTSISGGVKIILEYCNRLAERGHVVNLVSMSGGYPDWIPLHPSISFCVVDWHDSKKRIVQELPNADALIATQWFTTYFVAGISLSKGAKFYLVQDYESQTITTPENADPTYILPLRKIVVSSWLENLMGNRFGQKSEYIRNAIDTKVLYHDPVIRPHFPASEIRIGMLWHTEPRKDVSCGIEAFELIKNRYPIARLIMFGTTEPENIKFDEFHRNISGSEVRNYFCSLDFFVSTSWQEGFGLPGLEAMACGVSLVTTDSGGIIDYAVNGETALVVPPRDPAAIAHALSHLIENKSLRENLRQSGLAKAAEFSWDLSVQTLEKVLQRTTSESVAIKNECCTDNIKLLVQPTLHKSIKVAVLSMDPKEHACNYYRVQSPLGAQRGEIETSWSLVLGKNSCNIDSVAVNSADLFVVQRLFPRQETTSFLDYLCSLGKPIIYEIDDLLTQLPLTNPCHDSGTRSAPYINEFIRKCSAVTVSTEELKRHFLLYNNAIQVLPNLLNSDLWCRISPPSTNSVVIGYAGTITHGADLELLEGVLERIASSYGNKVVFTFMGCVTERISKLPGFTFIQFQDTYEAYARKLQEIPIDIMLVPLDDNPFNRCKSNIKWLEYSACGFAGIYSDLPPYNTDIEHGKTGLLVENAPHQWFDAITILIDNPTLRRSIAFEARRKVMAEHTLKVGAHRWLQVYREVLSQHIDHIKATAEKDSQFNTNIATPERVTTVSIIIPVFNQLHFTQQCLQALFRTLPSNIICETIVVDNASSDRTDAYLRCLGERVQVISNPTNLGFAKACNQGARAACGEYLLFLNNDTVVQPGWLEPLLTAMQTGEADICGARLLYPDGRCQHAGIAFDERGLGYHIFSGFPGDAPEVLQRRLMQAVTGACLIISKQLFTDLEGFDEEFRNGFEDVDLCLRAGKRGKRILYLPESVVVHYTEQTPGRKDHDIPNMQRFFRRWLGALRQDDQQLYRQFGLTCSKDQEGRFRITRDTDSVPQVSVIIPLFNQVQLTEACLLALQRFTPQGCYELILVDNASTDGTPALLERWRHAATVIRNLENAGFARACNQGARAARGEFLLFLNNDTEVTDSWFEPLLEVLEQDASVAAVGSKLLYPDGTIQHAGVLLVDDRQQGDQLVARHLYQRMPGDYPAANVLRSMQALTAACLLVRRTAFEAAGGFDEGYWNGYEDVDLCLKLAAAGQRIVYQPASVVLHHESQSGLERFSQAGTNIQHLHMRWLGKVQVDAIMQADGTIQHGPGILNGTTAIYQPPAVSATAQAAQQDTLARPRQYQLVPLVTGSSSSLLQRLSSSYKAREVLQRYTVAV